MRTNNDLLRNNLYIRLDQFVDRCDSHVPTLLPNIIHIVVPKKSPSFIKNISTLKVSFKKFTFDFFQCLYLLNSAFVI